MTAAAARLGAGVLVLGSCAHLLPSIATIPAVHKRLLPRLSGAGARSHIALTFDDGPDAESTPVFLDELARLQVHATFFVLGAQMQAHPGIAKRIVEDGHEVAVHGWRHRPHLLRSPWAVHTDMRRAYDGIREVTGATPRFWRPPNGILTGAGLGAAYLLGLQPVLWTADGRDWRADATAESVSGRIESQLGAGGTVLLHDSDVTSAPASWRAAAGPVAAVVALCTRQGWAVGPLRDHWAGAESRPGGPPSPLE